MSVYNVVRFAGFSDRRWLLYRHPAQAITNSSRLIVGANQLGIVVMDGSVKRVYESGIYYVNSLNFPFIKSSNKNDSHRLVFYFFNKEMELNLDWNYHDNIRNNLLVDAKGNFVVEFKDFQVVLIELISKVTKNNLIEKEKLIEFLNLVINSEFANILEEFIQENNLDVNNFKLDLHKLSKKLLNKHRPVFKKYGLDLVDFQINNFNLKIDNVIKEETIKVIKPEFIQSGNKSFEEFRKYEKAAPVESVSENVEVEDIKPILETVEVETETKVESEKDQCPKCGKVSSGAHYCWYCGSPMKLRCPLCNKELKKDEQFCSGCGTKVNS